jgi:hypothetical protein
MIGVATLGKDSMIPMRMTNAGKVEVLRGNKAYWNPDENLRQRGKKSYITVELGFYLLKGVGLNVYTHYTYETRSSEYLG